MSEQNATQHSLPAPVQKLGEPEQTFGEPVQMVGEPEQKLSEPVEQTSMISYINRCRTTYCGAETGAG